MSITPLPTPPSRNDPTNFATRADAFLGALPTFATEANALAVEANADAAAAAQSAIDATNNGAAQVALAAAQAGVATTQAGISTTQAGIATTQAGIATTKAAEASASADAAAASAENISLGEKLNLGAKASDPTVDNQGDPLLGGAIYYNTVAEETRQWTGTFWKAAATAVNGTASRQTFTATAGQTTFSIVYDIGFVDLYLNGLKLQASVDFTATNGTSIVLASPATSGDVVDIVAYGAFSLANTYTQAQTDTLLSAKQATLVSGTNIKTINGATVLGSGDITISADVTRDEANAMKANIAMNSFRIATLGSYSFMKMVDGVADDYVDQTGIAAASGFNYESGTKSYASGPSYSAPGGTGNRTSSITVTTNLAITSGSVSSLVDGTTSAQVQFTYDSNINGNWVVFDFGSGNAKSVGEARVYAYESTTRGFWKWQGSNDNSTWVDTSSSVQITNGVTAWTFTDSTAYRYHRIAGVSGGIDAAGGMSNGWGEVEFKIGSAGAAGLISNAVAALSTPTAAQVILWQENIASLTLNTDLTAWVTRESGKTFTTAFGTSTTAINSTAHGFVNGDRVLLLSSSELPTGLSNAVAYYVVSASANAFSVSLTAGGSAVTFSSDGSGTHTARKVAQATLAEEAVLTSGGRVLSGLADISGQATGTSVRYAIIAPTNTAARIHATSVQWK